MKSRLQKHFDTIFNIGFFLLMISHFFIICTLIVDLKGPLDTSGLFPHINWFCGLLNYLTECIPAKPDHGTVISSLLVVWTFITAIMIFYMEKKDLMYCGIRHWEIISFDMAKWIKQGFFLLFFTELLVLLAASFRFLPLTTACLCLLYPITAAVIFLFVGWVTQDRTIEMRYLSMLEYQYFHNTPASGILEKDIPALHTCLKQIKTFTDKDWNMILKILTRVFPRLFNKSSDKEIRPAGELSYKTIKYVLGNIKNADSKESFLKTLAATAESETKEYLNKVDILTALLLPAVEETDNAGNSYYITALSAIKDNEKRQELLMRGLVFTYYQDYLQYAGTTHSSYDTSVIRQELCAYTTGRDSRKNTEYIIRFTRKLQKADPDSGFNITHIINLL